MSFTEAVEAALSRPTSERIGTQNEKLIHAALKNYYAPYSDEQEVKLGSYFADAVSEDGIYEIQTRSLYRLLPKLREFTAAARVTVVHPVTADMRTQYIRRATGEVVRETARRRCNEKLRVFRELFSIRELIGAEGFAVILACLSIDRLVYFEGDAVPDLSKRGAKKRVTIERLPLAMVEEIRLETPRDYARWLPAGLPETFTKKRFCEAAEESAASFRLPLLREAGVLEQVGMEGRAKLYRVRDF